MGVAGAIIGAVATLGSAWMSGRAQQEEAAARAEQERVNAAQAQANQQIAEQNARAEQERAMEQARIENENAEVEHRKRLMARESSEANRGASGVAHSGSAAALYDESTLNMDLDRARDTYTGRQKVDSIFGQANDYTNQASQYGSQSNAYLSSARTYNSMGSKAMRNSFLTTGLNMAAQVGFAMAGANYSDKSSAKNPKIEIESPKPKASSTAAWGTGW